MSPNRYDTNQTVQPQQLARSLISDIERRHHTIDGAKTRALISCAVTAQLICVFVFAYADPWFSGAGAHLLTMKSFGGVHVWCSMFYFKVSVL